MSGVEIKHLDIRTEADQIDVEYIVDDFLRGSPNDDRNLGGGKDCGAVVVRIAVDGDFDRVQTHFVQTGDMEGLDRAIAALVTVREQLAALYDARPRADAGRCLAHGDWGRCGAVHGHDGEHQFPTDEQAMLALASA